MVILLALASGCSIDSDQKTQAAHQLLEDGNAVTANTLFSEIFSDDPSRADATFGRAEALTTLASWPSAYAYYQRAISLQTCSV